MPTQTWIVSGPSSRHVPDVRSVRVQLIGGSVEVTASDVPGVHLEVVELVGHPLEATVEAGRLTLGYASLGWEGWIKRLGSYRGSETAAVRVLLGPGVVLKVGTVSASVSVARVAEDVSLATAGGHVQAVGGTGALVLRSVSGDLTVTDHAGTVRAQSVSGDLRIAGDLARADVATVSGDADVSTTAATSVLRAQTVSGAVAVTLPDGVGLVLNARTVTGQVVVDGEVRRSGATPSTTTIDERGPGAAAFVDLVSVNGALAVSRGGGVAADASEDD